MILILRYIFFKCDTYIQTERIHHTLLKKERNSCFFYIVGVLNYNLTSTKFY